ncbi:HNH endonuclease [Mycolicibacterium acapulense]|uniref:HNH endonuclease n=1 Tax=Mycobacterium lehmannii TaxID=2048550 RepID=A0A101A714_9MYCO|nr:HNH endonuclease signature motif containing protein [Mycobacterium lehmannii]KUI00472.1 HNH endonuclease [Mycolicibacterium acapulense]KUI04956.1 HNH endonuclease [Mycolicibacterium acapulense]KUI16281.1 HNH endonuclease [Mycobacterium lehmannii]KUI16690.1 HNH endonuclease [Mycolicibacterium acapulense]
MFDELMAAADGARSAGAIGAWARVENAACARRLAAAAEVLERLITEAGAVDREQWCIDNWTIAAAEVAAAQGVSLGVASHQLLLADDLRRRLPRVAEVFATGAITYRTVAAVAHRSRLVRDAGALAKLDTDLATHLTQWGTLSTEKLHAAIDICVDRYDPAAVRRTEYAARGRHIDIHDPGDGSGTATIEGTLLATDADALDTRLDAMAAAVCAHDPRTAEQRRSDALGAIGHGADRLACACGRADCDAAAPTASAVLVHLIAREESLGDDTPAQLDGHVLCSQEQPPAGPAATDPGYLMGKGLIPAPLLASKLAATATLQPVIHPGQAGPEPRYRPSAKLAWFVRCRDITCRFPGCDVAATDCDIDHTVAYPAGPTQAANLKCLCRQHHLLKTFAGWRDKQYPDGRIEWTSREGQTYTTHPGSRLLFPQLCRPTAPAVIDHTLDTEHDSVADQARTLKMPRRKQTRTQARDKAITDERQHNEAVLQAEAEQRAHARKQGAGSETACGEDYFPSRPRPPDDDDPPPF